MIKMNNQLTTKIRAAKRLLCLCLAIMLSVAALPLFQPHSASAAQFNNRYIEISDSGQSGTAITGVGSGDNVTYKVSFDAVAASSDSLVIDFCSDSPLIDSTCTAPTGFDVTVPGAALVTGTGQVTSAFWTLTTPSASQIKIAGDGAGGHHIVPGTQTFELTGIQNPSTLGSFYARIYTYSNTSWGTYASATASGNYQDFGGIAMSTVRVISVTARVQEQLTFCTTTAAYATWTTSFDCSDPAVASAPPAIVLGHGSPVELLDASTVDMKNIYTELSTNATNGVTVRMRDSNTSCGGLSADGGTTCSIPAQNSGSGAGAAALPAGAAAFGLFVPDSTLGSGGSGTLTPSSVYHNGSHVTVPTDVWFGMDTTTSGNNVISTYGSTLCSTGGPIYRVNDAFTFAATSALTTPAGIYTANMVMIATGTF